MTLKHLRSITVTLLLTASVAFGRQPQKSTSEIPAIKIDVDLVLITAGVTDSTGQFVPGLGKEQFQVWEDKVQQKVEFFSAEEIPASIGIVFDVSGSMEDKISFARDAAVSFLKNGNRSDEYFLVEFSDLPHVTEDFTPDISRLQNHLIFAAPKGSTALLDAVYLAAEKVKHGRNPRKAILLITDGEDNRSRYRLADVVEFLKESDVQVYAIGLVSSREPVADPLQSHFSNPWRPRWRDDVSNQQMPFTTYSPGEQLINTLVNVAGGRAFFPDSVYDLEEICLKMALQLKNQYVVGYQSTNANKDGKWRKVRVKLNPVNGAKDLIIHAKTGYYAAKGERP